MERARVERLERVVAAKAKKKIQSLAECRESSETLRRLLAEDGELLQEILSKVATVTTELRESCKPGLETARELKVAKADHILQSNLC